MPSESAISKAVRDNLKRNVLCGELDLSTGVVAASVAIGDEETLDDIPQEYIDGAFNQLNRTLKTNSTVHQGIYKGAKKGLSLFTAIGGISTPEYYHFVLLIQERPLVVHLIKIFTLLLLTLDLQLKVNR